MTGGCCECVQCCRGRLGSVSYFYRGHSSSSTRNGARVLQICELVFGQLLLFSREALRISFLGYISGCRRSRKDPRQSIVVRRLLAVRSSQLGPRCARFHHALPRRCVVGRYEGVRSWLLLHALLGALQYCRCQPQRTRTRAQRAVACRDITPAALLSKYWPGVVVHCCLRT